MEKTKLCVIGDPVEHSLSPVIHNTVLDFLGLPFAYGRVQMRAADTAAFLRQAKQEGYGGFNATMPHKTALVELVDELEEDARLFRAVNTVVLRDGKSIGCNTDGDGFLQMLLERGFSPEGKTVTVLGAGGAARAVVLKLAQAGALRIFVCNRTVEKARELEREFTAQITALPFEAQVLRDCALFSDLMVNTTPMGMTNVAGQFDDLSFLDDLKQNALVCDLIYSPAETEFLRYAKEKGHPTANGLGMLIHQALFALEKFTGAEIDREAVLPAVEAELKKKMKA